MNVAELITLLEDLPQDAEIMGAETPRDTVALLTRTTGGEFAGAVIVPTITEAPAL